MRSKLASPLSSKNPEDAYRTAIERNQDHLRRFGPLGIFHIASETAEAAWYLCGTIFDSHDKTEAGDVVRDELFASFRSNVLCLLAILFAGEPCLRPDRPIILTLDRAALAFWPGQPLHSFGQRMPVLEAVYHYANDARVTCMRAMGQSEWHVETHQHIPQQLTDGFELLVEKISTVRDWLPRITNEQYLQSDTVLWRLHDICERRSRRLRPTGQRPDVSGFDDVQVKKVAKALEQHGAKAKTDVICRASKPMRRGTCLAIRRFLIDAGTGNHGT